MTENKIVIIIIKILTSHTAIKHLIDIVTIFDCSLPHDTEKLLKEH